MRSATTCDAGLNYRHAPIYALSRILETASMSPIEFEAELCGYASILRAIRHFPGSMFARHALPRHHLKNRDGRTEWEPTAP